jgi:hypothetical protein
MTKDEALKQELVAWRNAALRVGEDLCSVGPFGYYDMTAEQWLDWALSVVTVHAPPAAPVQEPVAELMHEPDVEVLRQQMRGRAQFLRDRGEVKTPQLLEIASELITPPATGKDQP